MTDELDTTEADDALFEMRRLRQRVSAEARAFEQATTPERGESFLDKVDMVLSRMTREQYLEYHAEVNEERREDLLREWERRQVIIAISKRNRGEE